MTKTEIHELLPVSKQVQLLLEYCVDAAGRRRQLSEVAQATGISDQALMNLLQGKSTNPRLKTLQALCDFYGISLDYFACETENACRDYLYLHQIRAALPLIREIEDTAAQLSAKGQRNVLAIMEWMRLAGA